MGERPSRVERVDLFRKTKIKRILFLYRFFLFLFDLLYQNIKLNMNNLYTISAFAEVNLLLFVSVRGP